jgi:NADPH2:quinone reductase
MMRQVEVTAFGGPEVLIPFTREDLVPESGQVVIEVEAADTLFLETVVRAGSGQDYWPQRPPYVPGNGVAGRVASIGAGVAGDWHGRRVTAHTGGEGGYADQAVVPVESLSPIPDTISATTAAALLHDGPTALRLFEQTDVGPDDTVLVVGASGGLGLLSLQLARSCAGDVLALARDQTKMARIRALGFDVVDTEQADWVDQARDRLGTRGADVILDNVGGTVGEESFELLAHRGRFSHHGTPSGSFTEIDPVRATERVARITGIETVQLSPTELTTYTNRALVAAETGRLSPLIGHTVALERASDAHRVIEDRTAFGKTILSVA